MSGASTFSSICFERGCCWFKGDGKIDKRANSLTLGSRFRVSANSSASKDIRIGLFGASGYTGTR
ncbi:unnamed protein product [Eruca vesicaria subsp. sativa]|uniref:Uncharacterized protein n=1 Tax=Eruca vesicaria subsp. sativa TaxID=29727 RepID=A0ABC8KEI5_ERUVS|nr:unnamed protein product [Eruca vesicaria subsp. sativa]